MFSNVFNNVDSRPSISLVGALLIGMLCSLFADTTLAAPPCDPIIDLGQAVDPQGFVHRVGGPLDAADGRADGVSAVGLLFPSSGLLTLEVSRATLIDFSSRACRSRVGDPMVGSSSPKGLPAADVLVAESSRHRLVLAARTPGVVFLHFEEEETEGGGEPLEIFGGFTEAEVVVEQVELDGMPMRRTSFLALGAPMSGDSPGVPSKAEEVEHALATFLTFEVSSLSKGDPEEVEPDPDGQP